MLYFLIIIEKIIKGNYTWADNRIFIGYWKDNRMEGRGVFKWPCGKSYEGSYKNNKREGFGVFSWADGRKFKGDWIRGKQQGKGEFFIPESKHWYKGFWEAGKLINYENPDDKSIIDCNRYNVDHEITVNLGEKENMSKNDGNDDNHLSGSGNENCFSILLSALPKTKTQLICSP